MDFVRVILAVRASVTPPAAVDALPIRTLELMAAAATGRLLRMPIAILWPLVGAVGTVAVAIAAPLGWNTHGVVALEGAAAAGGFGAGGLIGAVRTVVILVADKGGGDTLAVGTPKLVLLAFFGSWSGRKRENVSSTMERRIVLISLSWVLMVLREATDTRSLNYKKVPQSNMILSAHITLVFLQLWAT